MKNKSVDSSNLQLQSYIVFLFLHQCKYNTGTIELCIMLYPQLYHTFHQLKFYNNFTMDITAVLSKKNCGNKQ